MELKTEATITKAGIKSEEKTYNHSAATVLDLSFSLRLPKPEAILNIEAWSTAYGEDGGSQHTGTFEREQAKKAAPKKKAKGKSKEPEAEPCEICGIAITTEEFDDHECPPCPTCNRSGIDREECECGSPIKDAALAAYLEPHYQAYVEKKRAHNRGAMLASQRAALFISLINAPVRITLEPVQDMLFALTEGNE